MWGSSVARLRRRISGRGVERRSRLAGTGALLTALAVVGVCAPAAEAAGSSVLQNEWWLGGSLDYQGAWSTGGSQEGAGVTVAVIGDVANTNATDLAGTFQTALAFPPTLTSIDVGANDAGNECLATEVSSLIAGHGHTAGASKDGMFGIAPYAKVLPIAVGLDSDLFADSTYVSEAIHAAVDGGAKVIQVIYKTRDDATVSAAVSFALAHGVAIVAQTGNDGQAGNAPIAPSDLPGVIAVAGVEHSDLARWPNSISGPQVVVAAPATDITAEQANNGYGVKNSTSCAASMVSGELADLYAAHPSWTLGQVERVLIGTASGHGSRLGNGVGYGVINPTAAMQAPAPTQTTSPLAPAAQPSATATPAAKASTAAAAPRGSSGSGGSGSGSGGMIVIIVAIVVGVLLVGALIFLLRGRLRRRRRYVVPEPAPIINAGPSDYAALYQPQYPQAQQYQQQPEYQQQPAQYQGHDQQAYSQEQYRQEAFPQPQAPQQQYPQQQPVAQPPSQPPQPQQPQYPYQAPNALDESGYTINPYFAGEGAPEGDAAQHPQQGGQPGAPEQPGGYPQPGA